MAGAPTTAEVQVAEAYAAAARRDTDAVSRLIVQTLQIDPAYTETCRRILLGPWDRIYDLTGAPLANLVSDQVKRRQIVFSDATQVFHPEAAATQVIQFLGSATNAAAMQFELPNGGGIGPRDLWFRQFCADLVSRPVIVITRDSQGEIWTYLRGRVVDQSTEVSSPGFYLTADLTDTDKLRCSNCNLVPFVAGAGRISELFGASMDAVANGHRSIANLRQHNATESGAQLVSRHLRDAQPASWDFLRGYDPRWADIKSDRIVRLSRMTALWKDLVLTEGTRNIVLVKGRAGSGKTALLMRLGYELQAKGYTPVWIDRSETERFGAILDRVEALGPDVVLVDDLDIFGESSGSFVRKLNRNGKVLVVASARTTRTPTIALPEHAKTVDGDVDLSDADLIGLVRKLNDAGFLGILKGVRPDSARVDRLRELSHRDLLAALIEVVDGQPFEERIRSEYKQLSEELQNAYALICFGASCVYETIHMPETDMLQMITPVPPYGRSAALIGALVASGLILRETQGLRVRHRAIADVVAKAIPKQRVEQIVRSMLIFYAGRAAGIRDGSHPDRRQMIHLLNHNLMGRKLNLSRAAVRSIYEDVQPLLSEDFHFWLQRGAYEVEKGDLDLADKYLLSARGCIGGTQDYKVTTEWGLMRLKKAIAHPGDDDMQRRAFDALAALEEVARREGEISPHTFTVIVRHGVKWLQSESCLGDAERTNVLTRIQDIFELGLRVCMDNPEFRRVSREVRKPLVELARDIDIPRASPTTVTATPATVRKPAPRPSRFPLP